MLAESFCLEQGVPARRGSLASAILDEVRDQVALLHELRPQVLRQGQGRAVERARKRRPQRAATPRGMGVLVRGAAPTPFVILHKVRDQVAFLHEVRIQVRRQG